MSRRLDPDEAYDILWIEDAQYMGPGYTIRQDEDGRPQVFIQAPYLEPERVQGDVVLSAPDDGHGSIPPRLAWRAPGRVAIHGL